MFKNENLIVLSINEYFCRKCNKKYNSNEVIIWLGGGLHLFVRCPKCYNKMFKIKSDSLIRSKTYNFQSFFKSIDQSYQNKIGLLIVIDGLYISGVQKHILNLIKEINKLKFFPIIFALQGGGPLLKTFISQNIPVIIGNYNENKKETIKIIESFNLIFKKLIFLANLTIPIIIISKIKNKYPDIKLIAVLHIQTDNLASDDSILKFKNQLLKYNLIITVSESIKKQIINEIPEIKNRTICIKNSVTLSNYNFSKLGEKSQIRKVGTVTRFDSDKIDIINMINLTKNLKNQNISQLSIIGEGELKEKFLAKIDENHLSDFTNYINKDFINNKIYREFDIFLLPTKSEGTPYALLEAMATGIPTVVYRNVGVEEIIDNESNGFIIEPNNFSSLNKIISTLNQNKDLKLRIIENAFLTIKNHYLIENWIRKYEETLIRISQ